MAFIGKQGWWQREDQQTQRNLKHFHIQWFSEEREEVQKRREGEGGREGKRKGKRKIIFNK